MPTSVKCPCTYNVVATSANISRSLKANVHRPLDFLVTTTTRVALADLAYTTTARRMHHSLRKVFVTDSLDHLITSFRESLTSWVDLLPAATGRPDGNRLKSRESVALAFTGQGSAYVGMGGQLFKDYQVFREVLQQCDQLASSFGFLSFPPIITTRGGSARGSGCNTDVEDAIDGFDPVQTKLATVCLEYAIARLLGS